MNCRHTVKRSTEYRAHHGGEIGHTPGDALVGGARRGRAQTLIRRCQNSVFPPRRNAPRTLCNQASVFYYAPNVQSNICTRSFTGAYPQEHICCAAWSVGRLTKLRSVRSCYTQIPCPQFTRRSNDHNAARARGGSTLSVHLQDRDVGEGVDGRSCRHRSRSSRYGPVVPSRRSSIFPASDRPAGSMSILRTH
jgi:hypothetical protein